MFWLYHLLRVPNDALLWHDICPCNPSACELDPKMWKTAITLCDFYTRHVNLIALLLSVAFAGYFAVTGDPGSISFDLFVLFYGGLAGYTVAGCLMVPVFLFQRIAGVESAPNEPTSAMEGVLFRRHKKTDAKRGAAQAPDV